MKEMLYEVQCLKSNEDMILAKQQNTTKLMKEENGRKVERIYSGTLIYILIFLNEYPLYHSPPEYNGCPGNSRKN